ncbi:MAG: zinc-ribbon domain-containing protein, partial [Ktedonobacterales bacterium]|nr:zinc-ribbon domain-containing protein [Ktedonobacterales bacterium]
MPCPNCHADVPPGAEFCTHCGTPLDSQAPDTEGHQPPIPEQGANQTAPSYPLPPPYVPYGGSPYAPPYADQPYTDSPYAPPSQPYAPPSQPYAPPSQPYSNLYSQPLPGATYSQPLPTTPRPPFMPDLFGANVAPAFAVPRTRAQALLLRYFPSRLGVSLWFTAALGAVVAAITGLILSFLVQLVWENLIKTTLAASSPSVSSFLLGSLDTSSLGLDPLKIFALAHHVPLVMTYSGNVLGASASGSGSLDLPLTGLLLVPALALTLGGYLSASSDYSHVARYSIARGALIAPFYGLITFFLAVVATSHLSGAAAGVSSVASIGSSPAHALVYGLLWGVLFGALGGWIQVSGRHWLAAALPTLQAVRNPRAAGAVAGAVIALVSGILIFLVLGFAALAFFNVHAAGMAAPVSTATTPQIGAGTAIGILLETMSIFGPTAAIWLFALATGAALNAFESITSTGLGPGGQRQVAGSLGFIGAQQTLTPSTLLLLGLVPLVCYLIGGRVAARIARAPDVRAAAVAGALMAVPLSLLMAALAAAVSVGLRVSAFGQTIS